MEAEPDNNTVMSQNFNIMSSQLPKLSSGGVIPLFSSASRRPAINSSAALQMHNKILSNLNFPRNLSHPIETNHQNGQKETDYNYKPISEIPSEYQRLFSKFPYFNKVQSKVFEDILYSNNPLVLSAPTGSGKTVVFELAIVRALVQCPKQDISKIKIVYMAPLKALCNERLADWRAKFSPYNLKCLEVTGDSDVDDYSAIKTANLIFTTPEKWDSVTRRWKQHASQMQDILLFLVDEVHMVGDPTRGSTVEAVISRMKCVKEVTKSALRFVAVSATIPNPEDFASWLSSSSVDSICFNLDESYRPVPLQKVVLSYNDCTPSTAFKFDINLNYKLRDIIQKYSPNKPTIVFCSTRKSTVQSASTLQSQRRFVFDDANRQHIRDTASNVVDAKLRELLICGIGYHHAGLTQGDRQIVERLFLQGYLPVICATSTLAMGVNLPAHLVIVKSTLHFAGGHCKEYTSADVLQMIGRAGRPQFDTSATAVIMTQNCTRKLYNDMVSGSHTIESSFHHHLTEHLNSEIVLKTLTHVRVATQWMTSLFLYVRISKNPAFYGLPKEASATQIREYLKNAVMGGITSLRDYDFITLMPDGSIQPTEAGSLMARYCISFNTMTTFSKLKGDETLQDILTLLSASKEFSDVQLRVTEKSALNLLNKNRNGPVIRYPFKDRIKTVEMKISVLIQAVLGCMPINEFALNQESLRIIQVASRLSRCLLEHQSKVPSFLGYVSCLLLMKSLHCKLWENTKFVTRQFKNVGPMLSGLLSNAGLVNLQKVLNTDARDIELITNKHPPFGTNIIEQASSLPQYDMFVQQIGDLDSKKASLQVTIKPKQSVEPSFDSSTSLVIGTPENSLIFKRKLKDKTLFRDQSFSCEVTVYRAVEKQTIIFWLIGHTHVGADIKSTFSPKFSETISFNSESVPKMRAQLDVASTSAGKKFGISNPYRNNPYSNNLVPHSLKMDQKLQDSSRIIVSKGINRNEKSEAKINIDQILKPGNSDDNCSDFDDLPEFDWTIQEVLEPTKGQIKVNEVEPSIPLPPPGKSILKSSMSCNQSEVPLKLKPQMKPSNTSKDESNMDHLEAMVQEMEDSGYFDEFQEKSNSSTSSFDFGVDDLLSSQVQFDAPPPVPEPLPINNKHYHQSTAAVPNKQQYFPRADSRSPDKIQSRVQPTSARITPCPNPVAVSPYHREASRTGVLFPIVKLAPQAPDHENLPSDPVSNISNKCETHEDLKIVRVDENGDQFRACGHKCADKTSCSHFCCRYGVKVKPPNRKDVEVQNAQANPRKMTRPFQRQNVPSFYDIPPENRSSNGSTTDSFVLRKSLHSQKQSYTDHPQISGPGSGNLSRSHFSGAGTNPYSGNNKSMELSVPTSPVVTDSLSTGFVNSYTPQVAPYNMAKKLPPQAPTLQQHNTSVQPMVQTVSKPTLSSLTANLPEVTASKMKRKYFETFSSSDQEKKAVPQSFEATQPPKFQTNVGFYNHVSKAKKSSVASIFDGIF